MLVKTNLTAVYQIESELRERWALYGFRGRETGKSVVRSCTHMELPLLLRLNVVFCLLAFLKGLCHTREPCQNHRYYISVIPENTFTNTINFHVNMLWYVNSIIYILESGKMRHREMG